MTEPKSAASALITCQVPCDSIDDPWIQTRCGEPAPYCCANCDRRLCAEHSNRDPISEERFCAEDCP